MLSYFQTLAHQQNMTSKGGDGAELTVEEVFEVLKEDLSRNLSCEEWHSEPLTIFVYGASGDLAHKKTYPALIDLFKGDSLPEQTMIVGYARSEMTQEEFHDKIRPSLKKHTEGDDDLVERFLKICSYANGAYSDSQRMKEVSKDVSQKHKEKSSAKVENRVFYLALPPTAFVDTSRSIKEGALSENGFNRVVVEKPFGHDTESAGKLGEELGAIFPEDNLYRIDHYLGKEMVQNLVVMRFGNAFLEPIWNRNFVDSVTITFKEEIGTMGRGGYFDSSGIIRDVMQNHLMQVLSIVALEPPVKVAGKGYSNYVRDEKVKVLNCMRAIRPEDVVIGQYVSNGTEPGYKDDDTVPNDSNTPTYCACVMYIDNARWAGVPFIMKAGKALDNKKAEVRIQLKSPPGSDVMFDGEDVPRNELVIRLQPNEAVYMKTNVKKPGLHTVPIQSELDLTYDTRFRDVEIYDAYARLVLDVLRGKQATFVRNDELMAAWKIFTPILNKIDAGEIKPTSYEFGSRGPKAADEMIANLGFERNVTYGQEWHQNKL